MVLRVQRIGDDYGVVLSREALETLHLTDGAEVELRPVVAEANLEKRGADNRYATVEEGLEAFRRTESLHRNTYQELAK